MPVVLAPLSGRLHVLLVQRAEAPFAGTWVLPGGFMSPSERPEETAQRKLTEKTGVGAVYLEQLETYGDPRARPARLDSRRSRTWPSSTRPCLRADESSARWEPVDALPPLGFDHARIVVDAVERLRGKLWWSNIAVGLLPGALHDAAGAAGVRGDQRRDVRAVELPARARAIGPGARHRHARQGRAGTPRRDVRVRRTSTRVEPAPLAATGDGAQAEPDPGQRLSRSSASSHDTARSGATSERPPSRRSADDGRTRPTGTDPDSEGGRALPAHSASAHR